MQSAFPLGALALALLLAGCAGAPGTGPGSQDEPAVRDPGGPEQVPWWLNETVALFLIPQPPGATTGAGNPNCVYLVVDGEHELLGGTVMAEWDATTPLAETLEFDWWEFPTDRLETITGRSPLTFDAATVAQAHNESQQYLLSMEHEPSSLPLREAITMTVSLRFLGGDQEATSIRTGFCNAKN